MAYQEFFSVQTRGRGMTNISQRVAEIVQRGDVRLGIAHAFVRHTSCSLLITENADPNVRHDLETLAQRWAPDADPAYRHDLEGDDDMAAHARSILSGSSVSVPVADGKLLLGTWQGIYLWEHRVHAQVREVVVTLVG